MRGFDEIYKNKYSFAFDFFTRRRGSFSQTKKLRWTTHTCEFEGTYAAKKYSAAQLRDTLKLISVEYFPSTVDPTPQNYTDVKALNVETLDKEYQTRKAALVKLDIVKTKYWETLRQKQLKELEQVYQLSRATILGWKNPPKLKEVSFAGDCSTKYADPLIKSGSSLLKTWLEVNEESRRQNADPERLRREFERQLKSPEKLRYAQIEVMTFGWWNCANALIDREDQSEAAAREFKKLFTRVKTIYCDEP